MTPEILSALIGDIYDCALDAGLWPAAMARIAETFNAAYAAIYVFDPREMTRPRLVANSPWDMGMLRLLQERYAPNLPGIPNGMVAPLDVANSSIHGIGEEAFRQTPFYNDWAAPQKLLDGMAAKFLHNVDRMGVVACATPNSRAPISEAERNFMNLLCPHLRRAAMIGDLLDHQRLALVNFKSALDGLLVPVILTNAQAKIIYANAQAVALFSVSRFIKSINGHVQARSAAGNVLLADAIRRCSADPGELKVSGAGLPLSAPEEPAAVAYVLPLGTGSSRSAVQGATACIFISCARTGQAPPVEILQSMFGVTPAEAHVMQLIGLGLRPFDIAEALAISENTVKTHLARIFAKSGTSSQTEVVLLLTSLSAPARIPA